MAVFLHLCHVYNLRWFTVPVFRITTDSKSPWMDGASTYLHHHHHPPPPLHFDSTTHQHRPHSKKVLEVFNRKSVAKLLQPAPAPPRLRSSAFMCELRTVPLLATSRCLTPG